MIGKLDVVFNQYGVIESWSGDSIPLNLTTIPADPAVEVPLQSIHHDLLKNYSVNSNSRYLVGCTS